MFKREIELNGDLSLPSHPEALSNDYKSFTKIPYFASARFGCMRGTAPVCRGDVAYGNTVHMLRRKRKPSERAISFPSTKLRDASKWSFKLFFRVMAALG